MTKKQILVTFCLLMGLASCSSTSKNREELRDLKQRKVELTALSLHFQKKKNEEQLKKIKKEQKNINKKIIELESRPIGLEMS